MRRLAFFGAAVAVTTAIYTTTDYQPCSALTDPNQCRGASFDNFLLAGTSIGVGMVCVGMAIWTRKWSTRGLGMFAMLLIVLGLYGRATVGPRLLGWGPMSTFEYRVLRALMTDGTPLLVIGTLVWYADRIPDRWIPRRWTGHVKRLIDRGETGSTD